MRLIELERPAAAMAMKKDPPTTVPVPEGTAISTRYHIKLPKVLVRVRL